MNINTRKHIKYITYRPIISVWWTEKVKLQYEEKLQDKINRICMYTKEQMERGLLTNHLLYLIHLIFAIHEWLASYQLTHYASSTPVIYPLVIFLS